MVFMKSSTLEEVCLVLISTNLPIQILLERNYSIFLNNQCF
jgi:hypothetical protein